MGSLIKSELFNEWQSALGIDLQQQFDGIEPIQTQQSDFTFYTSVSVIASSKIEGEQLDVDSYVKHKLLHIEYLPELTQKPNDLYNAYLFSHDNPLTKINFLNAHRLVTAHLLPENQRGALRRTEMLVLEHKTGRVQYEAAPPGSIERLNETLWDEIEALKARTLSIEEVFYYAAFIHLAFVNIHPFADGNGRMARLLEKWFLSEKLGDRAWYIQSEKYYYEHVNEYYMNLARVGANYDELDYEKAIPFLLMLPASLRTHR